MLQGEIFLDVRPDAHAPFYVKTKEVYVKVLGTVFNLSSYDNLYQTTLVSGSVEVGLASGEVYRLRPSEQITCKAGSEEVDIKQVDTGLYTSWVEGTIIFKDETIEVILQTLSRWYDFDVVYDNPHLKDYKFGVFVNKYGYIDPLLKMLESTDKLSFEVNGRVVSVKESELKRSV